MLILLIIHCSCLLIGHSEYLEEKLYFWKAYIKYTLIFYINI